MLKKYIWPVIISLIILFPAYIINNWICPKLFNRTILSMLGNMAFIYYVFILSLINFGFLIYLFIKLKKALGKGKNRIYIGFSKVKKKELKNLKHEHRYILNYLVGEDSYGGYRFNLLDYYGQEFQNEWTELDMNLNLKELQRFGLIELQRTGAGGIFINITDRGCELLSKLYSS